eukprot:6460770-Pyramimonas_sp.AAC.2
MSLSLVSEFGAGGVARHIRVASDSSESALCSLIHSPPPPPRAYIFCKFRVLGNMSDNAQEASPKVEPLPEVDPDSLVWKQYSGEHELHLVTDLIDKELSEPYSIFTYRYFINQWPQLCFLVLHNGTCVGTIVCKMDRHRETFRGYIAMLVVDMPYRKHKLGTSSAEHFSEVSDNRVVVIRNLTLCYHPG